MKKSGREIVIAKFFRKHWGFWKKLLIIIWKILNILKFPNLKAENQFDIPEAIKQRMHVG